MSERPYRPTQEASSSQLRLKPTRSQARGTSIDTRGQDPEILKENSDRYFLSPFCQRLKISLGERSFFQLQSLVQQLLANGRITQEECGEFNVQTVWRHGRNIVARATDGHTFDLNFTKKPT